jgi:PAS domain S-box-containing protein
MTKSLTTAGEKERLDALKSYEILDSVPEDVFDDFTYLASQICATPIALISLIDAERQWFKSRVGLDASETPRNLAFCNHTINGEGLLEVSNAEKDTRFVDNPLVVGDPKIRFYAGMPLANSEGYKLGTLCVIDRIPRTLTQPQRDGLARLSRQVVAQFEARKSLLHQKQLNRQLAAQKAELKDFAENSNVALHWVDANGIILWANQMELDFLGYSREEYVGQPITRFHAEASVISDILRKLSAREKLVSYEANLIAKDGSIKTVAINSSVFEENGNFRHTRCFSLDISTRKKNEAAQMLLAAIVNNSYDAIVSKDLKGIITSWNAAAEKIFGYIAQEMVGQPIVRLFPPNRHDEERAILNEILIGNRISHFATERLKKNGESFPVSVTVSPMMDAKGNIVGISNIIRDISTQKATEKKILNLAESLQKRQAELEKANKELDAFSYTISHDLRAPLRHINGYAGMLKKVIGDQLDPKAERYLKTITEASAEMGQLIDGLLNFSRISRANLKREPIQSDKLVRQVIAGMELDYRGRNIIWKISNLPSANGDPALIKQVWVNLISNAVKYTRQRNPAVIEIGCTVAADRKAVFYVRDNGVGFDMKFSKKIFGVFERLHRQEEFEGLGIGLANAQRILARHGGLIWAESAPDQGALFSFTFPGRS